MQESSPKPNQIKPLPCTKTQCVVGYVIIRPALSAHTDEVINCRLLFAAAHASLVAHTSTVLIWLIFSSANGSKLSSRREGQVRV